MKLTVKLDRMRIRAFHGLLPQEKAVGNIFEVSVDVWLSVPVSCMATEDIGSTVNYAELAEMVKQIMSVPCDLIETVAVKIMHAVCDRWSFIEGGRVTVTKETPPVPVQMKGASVEIEW